MGAAGPGPGPSLTLKFTKGLCPWGSLRRVSCGGKAGSWLFCSLDGPSCPRKELGAEPNANQDRVAWSL